jgi:hypothetical protein
LFINEETGTLDFKRVLEKQDSTESINIPKINAQHYVYLETLFNHIERARKRVGTLKDAAQKAELQKSLNNIETPLKLIG